MLEFTFEHKHTKTIHKVIAENVMGAYKTEGLDLQLWVCIDIQEVY